MKRDVVIVDIKDIVAVEQSIGRNGRITAKELPVPTGVPGFDMDFTWTIFSEGYGTPRHRHTFDQVRFVLDGKFQSDVGDIETGECGYYPEGVHYGPQHQDDECKALILQFPGPSGIPYLKHVDLDQVRQRLIAEGGSFAGGVYTKVSPDGRQINKDSHAACFEAITGKKMEFPEGRFTSPVFMKSEVCRWVADRRLHGVEHKHLGTFGEWRTGMGLMRLAPGSRLPAYASEDAEIRYLLEGEITFDGRAWQGGKTRDIGTYMYIPHGAEVGEITSEGGGTFFNISLPMVAESARIHEHPDTVAA